MMPKQRLFVVAVALALMQLTVPDATAQSYPTKPIRILTSEVGGGNDFGARVVGQALTTALGQQVVIENRPARILGEIGIKATPDGYTLFVAGSSFAIGTLLQTSP